MSKIIKLPEEIANRIAAGEVVEKPASVLKELVENSIDANADFIECILEEGGKKLVQVIDDGEGMTPEDLRLALERHATSKIHSKEDLMAIQTLGFRGEALPSIASVSHLEIISRTQDAELGYRIVVDHGQVVDEGEVGTQKGTIVTVKELFSKVPARRRFLKSERAEYGACVEWFTKLALANPYIAFRLEHNGVEQAYYPSAESYKERIEQIFGVELVDNLLAIEAEYDEYTIFGFVSKRTFHRGRPDEQYIFLNNRPIKSALISSAIRQAYREFIPPRRYPVVFLFIGSPPELVDVNVHPAKLEVRFRREEAVFRLVYGSITKALGSIAAPAREPRPITLMPPQSSTQLELDLPIPKTSARTPMPTAMESQIIEVLSTINETQLKDAEQPNIMQVLDTYIVIPVSDGMYVIDQHSAHERVLYERVLQAISGETLFGQRLLFPIEIALPPQQMSTIAKILPQLSKIGFEVEVKDVNRISITAIPPFLRNSDIKDIINGLIDDLAEKINEETPSIISELAASIACHSAIKAGRKLSRDEMLALFEQLFTCEQPFRCPHGRPTIIKFTKSEFEKMFGRHG